MTFLVYQSDEDFLGKTGLNFRLAGYNLVHRIWESRGRPTDRGWHISRDDLAAHYDSPGKAERPYRFLIDFDPDAKRRIGLVELLDIYVYTFAGSENGKAGWSPMMLRLRDVLYEEFGQDISAEEKEKRTSRVPEPDSKDDFVEFLYLNGSNQGWRWGMSGMTNAAFIQGPAREYFRQYF